MRIRAKAMRIELEPYLWNQLKLEDERRYKLAVAAMYMGYGFESLKRLLSLPETHTEVTEVVRVAPLLGHTELDSIVKKDRT